MTTEQLQLFLPVAQPSLTLALSSQVSRASASVARPTFKPTTLLALCSQVNQVCPKCGRPLFIKKAKNSVKDYEIAHIYPLNPTPAELAILLGEQKLSGGPNDECNLIPLCFTCHKLYDTDKTLEDYRALKKIKERLLGQDAQRRIQYEYQIESDIATIMDALMLEATTEVLDADYVAKEIDTKLVGEISNLTKQKIKNDVSSFYLFVRNQLAEIEKTVPGQGVLIAMQVKLFYTKQKGLNLTQQQIFQNTVGWILSRTRNGTEEAAAVVAAFFVQNCELF